mgnify:CR=1 FL=1
MLRSRWFSGIALLSVALGALLSLTESGCADSMHKEYTMRHIEAEAQSQQKDESCWPVEFQNNNKRSGDFPDRSKVDCGEKLEQGLQSRRITVKLCIDEGGNVARAIVLKSLCPEADNALCDAMSKWQFDPYLADGKAVSSVCVLTVTIN